MTAPARRPLTTTDTCLVADLLWGVWRVQGYDSIDRRRLATVLIELGYRLRQAGIEPTPELLVDMGGYLNTPTLDQCEPPPTVRQSWWRRWRRGR